MGGLAGIGLYFPIVTVVPREGPAFVFTTDPDGIAPEVPPDNSFGPLFGEFDSAAGFLADWLRGAVPAAERGRIGIDSWTGAFHDILPQALPHAQFVNGESVMWDARKIKTPDEQAIMRQAEMVTEAALFDTLDYLRPGVTETELAAAFTRRVHELGYAEGFNSWFCAEPVSRAELPYAVKVLPVRKQIKARPLSDGELVGIDCSIEIEGYPSDLGRTWFCGRYAKLGPEHKDLFAAWQEVMDRVLENCRPGKTAADIHRAAGEHITSYVGHGLGIGQDPPIIGGMSISVEEEEKWVLEPGMSLVVEPIVFREGIGSYRSEIVMFITEQGYEPITAFPYGPFADP
jgi:Xaa-Pro aminopeptidase